MTITERIQATAKLMAQSTTPEQSIDAILANQLAIMLALERIGYKLGILDGGNKL